MMWSLNAAQSVHDDGDSSDVDDDDDDDDGR